MTKGNFFKILFSILGLVGLFFIIKNYGVDQILYDIRLVNINIIWILLSWIPVVYCYGLSWQLVSNYKKMGSNFFLNSFKFLTYAIISISWNNLTPFLKVGGEPVKYLLLKRHLTKNDALRSTINYNIVHALSTLLSLIFFSFLIPVIYDVKQPIFFYLIGSSITLFLSIIVFASLSFSKTHSSESIFSELLMRKTVRIVMISVKKTIRRLHFHYRKSPSKFILAIFIDTMARFIEGLTFYLAFLFIQQKIPFLTAIMLDVGRTFIDTFFFFIPYQIGAREEGIRFFMENIFQTSSTGFVSVVLLYRVVEIFWVFVGYILWIALGISKKELTDASAEHDVV